MEGGVEPYMYSLNGGNYGSSEIYAPLIPGSYTLSVEDANGCMLDVLVTVDEPEPLLLDLGPDQLIKLGDEVTVAGEVDDPSKIQSFTWNDTFDLDCILNPLCMSQTFSPQKSVTLRATIIDENGCTTSDVINVFVDDTPNVFPPNSFTPNNDGVNDLFTIYTGQGVDRVYDLAIFDRWGTQVYFLPELEPGEGWNGLYRNKDAPSGVYIYQFYVVLTNGEVKFFTGDVTLSR